MRQRHVAGGDQSAQAGYIDLGKQPSRETLKARRAGVLVYPKQQRGDRVG